MRCQLWVLPLALVLCICTGLQAATTGQLSGWVVDDEGTSLPGVSVSVSSPLQIGGEQLAQTDSRGMFLYPRLAPGVYRVVVSLEGFATQEITQVQVRLGKMTEVRVVLPLATFGEEVTVTEQSPVVDPIQVSTGQTFTDNYLEYTAIGLSSRGFYPEVLLQAAGTGSTDPGSESGGYPLISVHGSTDGENVFLIDGQDTTDTYRGLSPTMIPLDSIQEIDLKTAGFEAEYGRALGGVVNAITKSGSNELQGTLDLRYSDSSLEEGGENYDPDEQSSRSQIASFTLGGRFLRNRVWYFAALESLERQKTPPSLIPSISPEPFEGTDRRAFAKVTGRASPSWLAVGKFQTNPVLWHNFFTDPFLSPEANADDELDETILQASVSGVLTPSLLWEGQIAWQEYRDEYGPVNPDLSALSHYNLSTGIWSGNDFDQWTRDSTRRQLGTNISWLVDDAWGSHELKAGIDVLLSDVELFSCWTGNPQGEPCRPGLEGFLFLDDVDDLGNEIPSMMIVRPAPEATTRAEGFIPAVFVQDAWRVFPDLTLKLGLRWDKATYENDLGTEVADFDMLQPRLGVAWDVGRQGKSVFRASWGRFMHPSFLRLPRVANSFPDFTQEFWFSCTANGLGDPTICASVAAGIGTAWREGPGNWDPAGWIFGSSTGSLPTVVAPDLTAPYADEWTLGFEQQVLRRSSVELNYVDKETRDKLENTCIGNYPSPEFGADCSSFIIVNLPEARRDYTAWILRFESRALDSLHILSSYTYSDSKGTTSGSGITTVDFNEYPFHFDNRYGYVPGHRQHRLKINGFYLMPLGFSLGFNGVWGSPFRWTPWDDTVEGMLSGIYFTEPRGSREGDSWSQLDLQFAKDFSLGKVRLRLIASVLNALDSEAATRVCEDVDGCSDLELGDPIEWQQPRRYQLGLRLEY